jgi:hypothetical protein
VPQSALGKMFQYSQPNIHYRVNRALERIKVLLTVPVLEPAWIEAELSKHFKDEKDIKVMILLYVHSSQSYAARLVGESQGKVRYRFLRCLNILKEIESLSIIYNALSIINENLTLLRKGDTPFEIKRTIL